MSWDDEKHHYHYFKKQQQKNLDGGPFRPNPISPDYLGKQILKETFPSPHKPLYPNIILPLGDKRKK